MIKSVLRFFTVLCLTIIFCTQAYAVNVVQRLFNVQDGLANYTINDIEFDDYGYVWLGTEQGLFRVSSSVIRRIDQPDTANALTDENINFLVKVDKTHLLIGTLTSLVLYDIENNQFSDLLGPTDTFLDDYINAYTQLNNGNLALLTLSGGMFELDASSLQLKLIHQYKLDDRLIWNSVGQLADNKFIYSSRYQIEVRDYQGELIKQLDWGDDISIRGTYVDSFGNVWVYTSKGLFKADIANNSLEPISTVPFNIHQLVEDSRGLLWMTTTSGLFSYNPSNDSIESYKDQLKLHTDIDYVDYIAVDSHDLIWVGGSGEGLALLAVKPDFLIDYFNKASKYRLQDEMIWSIFAESEKVWLGGDGGLLIVDKQNISSSLHLPFGFEASDSVYGVTELGDEHIAIATTNGVFVYNKQSDEQVPFEQFASLSDGLKGEALFTAYQDPYLEGRIWWGAFNHLYYWEPELKDIVSIPLFDDNNSQRTVNISSVYRDKTHRLWVGGEKFFGYFDQYNRFNSLADILISHFSNISINNIINIDEEHLWLGTYQDGLIQFNTTTNSAVSVNEMWNAECSTIYFIQQLPKYNVVGCSSSVIRQNRATKAIEVFAANDGFISSEFNESAAFYDENLGLYLGSPDGAMLIDVEKLTQRVEEDDIFLESISVFYEDHTELNLLPSSFDKVRPDAKLISFQMTTFDYINTASMSLKYRLVSQGSAEIPRYISLVGQTQINIADLKAGVYTLELLHQRHGVWANEPFQFEFEVEQYWWASQWFKAVVLFTILFIAFSSVWLRQKQVQRVIGINSALRESEDKLRQSLRGSDSDLWEWDSESNQIHFENKSGILGERRQFSYYLPDLPIIEEDKDAVNQQWLALLKGNQNAVDIEFRYHRAPGMVGWLRIRGRMVSRNSETSQLERVAGIYTEISEQRELQNEIDLLAKAFENTSEGMLILDREKCIKVVNSAANTLLHCRQDKLIGQSFESLMHSSNQSYNIDDLLVTERSWNGELTFIREHNQSFPVWINISVMLDKQGGAQHYVVVFSDITSRKENELNLRNLANYDVLTGLANRSMFNRKLTNITENANQFGEKLALLFLDLDRFKHVNDSYGHSMGDALLVEAAKRLQNSVGEQHLVCRFGGDEFVILLRNANDVDQVNLVAETILQEICAPFRLFGREFFVSTSIGISIWPEDTLDPETLIKNADLAMYHAKEEGRGNFQYYSAERNAEALYHLRIESELRKALENNDLELFYQPQIDILQGDKFIGMEALIRWQHPQDGFIRPDIFIKVAESCGLIIDIDRWVLRQACVDGARWNELYDEPFQLSVNVSAVQFRQADFIDSLKIILADTGIPPKCLAIEITEGVLMKEMQIANSHLTQLKLLGIEVAIDDFGTGYSSLAYLRNFEVNTLKIDRSFLIDIATNEADQAIVSSIIELARNLKLHVVAEGIESYEQMEQVFSRGCYIIQGYYFAKPMPRNQLDRFIGLSSNHIGKND